MTNSYLLFTLADRLFGVRLMGAIEILGWRPARPVPLSYSFVEGLLEYRGTIYPVYNLAAAPRPRKAGAASDSPERSRKPRARAQIILLEENKMPFGIRVDSRGQDAKLEEQPAGPEKVQGIDQKFVKGIVV